VNSDYYYGNSSELCVALIAVAIGFALWALPAIISSITNRVRGAAGGRSDEDRNRGSESESRVQARLLIEHFALFCSRETRERLELIAADLRRDAKIMKAQGYGPKQVRIVTLWQEARSLLPVLVDGIYRALLGLLPFVRLLRKLRK